MKCLLSLQEVGRKSERITMLEKEKSSLIRELFQARSQPAMIRATSSGVGGGVGAAANTDNTFMWSESEIQNSHRRRHNANELTLDIYHLHFFVFDTILSDTNLSEQQLNKPFFYSLVIDEILHREITISSFIPFNETDTFTSIDGCNFKRSDCFTYISAWEFRGSTCTRWPSNIF